MVRVKESDVWSIRALWKEIGEKLGVPDGDLDVIRDNPRNNGDIDKFFDAVLRKFLVQVNPRPSWNRLADAVASRGIDRPDNAEKLRRY